jgi:hypothetical protein
VKNSYPPALPDNPLSMSAAVFSLLLAFQKTALELVPHAKCASDDLLSDRVGRFIAKRMFIPSKRGKID